MCRASNHQNIYRNLPRAYFPFTTLAVQVESPSGISAPEPASASTAIPEAVHSTVAAVVPPAQPTRRRSVPEAEQSGTSPSCPNNQSEQPSSTSARRRLSMLPLRRARSLGDAMLEESSSVVVSFQHPSKTRNTTTGIRRSWLGLQPWEGELIGGRSNPGCTRCGSRYVSIRIPSSKSTI
jgi:hypothetical protein